MGELKIIKGNRGKNYIRGKKVDIMRVAAYCRVSTDNEEQLNSYNSQVKYYTEMINDNPEWSLVDIYADEAITGTLTAKREDFKRMINDCMNGEIDMVITKSISRFARNTLDTIGYVRKLKEKNVGVYFEEENIDTSTMESELLLTILSSVAQQEVENTSANVKKGLNMKMHRGELIGFQGCLGYNYHKDTKSISVNEKEAEIVRYIFNRYIEGAGGSVISRELENLGYKSWKGCTTWSPSSVIDVIKNEKYMGDLLLGKTFTLDPISKKRLQNMGEEDQVYIKDHHEPIVSKEVFEEAQKILSRRNASSKGKKTGNNFTRKYAFSSMVKCAFCGSNLVRRTVHSGNKYEKHVWQCSNAVKKGKRFCPNSKAIDETVLERAFVKSYQLLWTGRESMVDDFLMRVKKTLLSSPPLKKLEKIESEIVDLHTKKERLLSLFLENKVDQELYDTRNPEIEELLLKYHEEKSQLSGQDDEHKNIAYRLSIFQKVLSSGEALEEFDRIVFESVIDKMIVGGYNEDGSLSQRKIVIVYKSGFESSFDSGDFKRSRKLSSTALDDEKELSPHEPADTCGVRGVAFPQKPR